MERRYVDQRFSRFFNLTFNNVKHNYFAVVLITKRWLSSQLGKHCGYAASGVIFVLPNYHYNECLRVQIKPIQIEWNLLWPILTFIERHHTAKLANHMFVVVFIFWYQCVCGVYAYGFFCGVVSFVLRSPYFVRMTPKRQYSAIRANLSCISFTLISNFREFVSSGVRCQLARSRNTQNQKKLFYVDSCESLKMSACCICTFHDLIDFISFYLCFCF